MNANGLMAAKVLILICAGVAFVWWQLRDLAMEKERREQQDAKLERGKTPPPDAPTKANDGVY
jgi:hypothetical protein